MNRTGWITLNFFNPGRISTQNRHVDQTPLDQDDVGAGGCMLVEVSDTGNGISEDVRERIFEPFYTNTGMGIIGPDRRG